MQRKLMCEVCEVATVFFLKNGCAVFFFFNVNLMEKSQQNETCILFVIQIYMLPRWLISGLTCARQTSLKNKLMHAFAGSYFYIAKLIPPDEGFTKIFHKIDVFCHTEKKKDLFCSREQDVSMFEVCFKGLSLLWHWFIRKKHRREKSRQPSFSGCLNMGNMQSLLKVFPFFF